MWLKNSSEIMTGTFIQTDMQATISLQRSHTVNCWAHLRRKFHEAIVVDGEDSIAKTGRNFCDRLFSIEAELDSLTSEERYNKRLTQERQVFETFWSWAEKNWLFGDTPKGAKASAAIYGMVETAKANGLDVFKYFELLLTVLPSMEFLKNLDILEELLLWNQTVQKICKVI